MGDERLCAGACGTDADRRRACRHATAVRVCLRLGCLLFAIASAGCALAPDIYWLIAARVAQGIAAAIVTPASLALIGSTFPRNERSAAIGVWAAASALAAGVAPILGGWLTENFGWRWIFWINPPVALLAFALLWFAPPDRREQAQIRFAWRVSACGGTCGHRLCFEPDRTGRRWRESAARIRPNSSGPLEFSELRCSALTPGGSARPRIP